MPNVNLFDIFEDKKIPEVSSNEIEKELIEIFRKHEVAINPNLIDELASIYKDSPPWKPWSNY